MSETSQLDSMLRREYDAGNYVRFLSLARRKLKRMKREAEDGTTARKLSIWKLLKRLPEIHRERRMKERLAARARNA